MERRRGRRKEGRKEGRTLEGREYNSTKNCQKNGEHGLADQIA
jgi:hypothetical protein